MAIQTLGVNHRGERQFPERTRWHNDIVFANRANTCGYSKPLPGCIIATLVRSNSWTFGGGASRRFSEQSRTANKF